MSGESVGKVEVVFVTNAGYGDGGYRRSDAFNC